MIAFTRPVPDRIVDCELTHLERRPIDVANARRQHAEYEQMLRSLGCDVRQLPGLADHPDSVFIEDTAIVVGECAVITRPGAESRRGETPAVADALRPLRRLYHIEGPGTLDGGDVLRVGKHVYVGASTRSNEDGSRQLADALSSHGYSVRRVPMRGCLHLKTAVSTLPDDALLLDVRCVDQGSLDGARVHYIHPEEPEGANVLVVGDVIVVPASAPRTRVILDAAGYRTMVLDGSELAKAEGGLTCCSLLVSS